MAKVLPSLDESEPVHGDLETVLHLTNIHKVYIYTVDPVSLPVLKRRGVGGLSTFKQYNARAHTLLISCAARTQ